MKSKEVKRKEAAERQAKYDALTVVQRIELALSRGAKRNGRELSRLYKLA